MIGLDAYATDWLDLTLRWLHVIAAIVWIGTSFYFVALDNHLMPPEDERDRERGVGGESWEIHGGGFYRIEKFKVDPPALPEPLHWYKWEAYTTWLSGFGLLVVLYYLNSRSYLIDPSVADLAVWQAVVLSIGGLGVAWVVYDLLCRLLGGPELLLGTAVAGLTVLAAWGAGELFSPHAAWLQVGAMLGTIMAANVLFNIIPAHWELVRAKQAGRDPNPKVGIEAKRRSVHNNYLTLPVLITMLSGHFAFLYGHSYAWLILACLMAIGAWIRHYFNLRHAGRTVWAIPVTAALAIAGIAVAVRPKEKSTPLAQKVPFATVKRIVEQRCATCHSEQPTDESFTTAPLGVKFDTAEQIRSRAEAIRQQAVDTQAMPLGNITRMTEAERDLLGAWIRQGALIKNSIRNDSRLRSESSSIK
jgi:uncharacterized membrane protein